ncbi:MAG: hypothetical protein KA146_01095 [Leptospiraceae bacterium]|nr:hypothetical protein [Leptospiraceae bacterium]
MVTFLLLSFLLYQTATKQFGDEHCEWAERKERSKQERKENPQLRLFRFNTSQCSIKTFSKFWLFTSIEYSQVAPSLTTSSSQQEIQKYN